MFIALIVFVGLMAGCNPERAPVYDIQICSEEEISAFTKEEMERLGWATGYGISASYTGDPPFRPDRGDSLLYADSGVKYKSEVEFTNEELKAKTFSVVALLDYQQMPFSLDGRRDWSHSLSVASGKEKSFQIETDPLPDGGHTLLVQFIFEEFDGFATTGSFSCYPNYANHGVKFLIVGNDSSAPHISSFETGVETNQRILDSGLYIHDESIIDEGLKLWSAEEVKTGEEIDFFVHLGSNFEAGEIVALIPLINSQQPDNAPSYFLKVPSESQRIYPMTVKAPIDEGAYELLVLYAVNP